MLMPSTSRRPSVLARLPPSDNSVPCALNVQELHGPVLTSCCPPSSAGTSTRSGCEVRAVGIALITSLVNTVSRSALCRSTTGDSPGTVIVSSSEPSRMSAVMLTVAEPDTSTPSRTTVLNPVSTNFTVYMPGRRFSMRYCPVPSLTAARNFLIRAVLDAAPVTPGNSAPDVSLTVPVMVACAHTTAGTNRITSAAVAALHTRTNFPDHENDSMLLLSLCVPSHAEMPCE